MMDRRENTLAILAHQSHDHIGNSMTDFAGCGGNLETFENGPAGGGLDGFGMLWAQNEAGFGGGIPAPGTIVLNDICEWESVIQWPDLDDYDWEGQAEAQLSRADRTTQVVEYSSWNGPFLRMMDLMGFSEGLVALYEEPEASKAFLNAIADFKIRSAERAVKYFKPDTYCIFDDVASEYAPFISPETYRDIIMPSHIKINQALEAMGVIPNLHVCGKPEILVPLFIEEGAHAWEVCQPENDLVGLGQKYGDKIAFIGGYDMIQKIYKVGDTEEEIRASVRACMDKYGPAGNYVFMGMKMPGPGGGMELMMQWMGWFNDEAIKYGTNFYNR